MLAPCSCLDKEEITLKRFPLLILIISLLVKSTSYGNEVYDKYIAIPYFKVLPNDSISNVFNIFGKSKIIETELAHNYVLYYDYKNKIGLTVCTYADNNIWRITIRKQESKDAILKLHEYASLGIFSKSEVSKFSKPENIELPDTLTLKGLKFGMSHKEIEDILETKLQMEGDEAAIKWDIQDGENIGLYGGLRFIFDKGKLISLEWFGVDP